MKAARLLIFCRASILTASAQQYIPDYSHWEAFAGYSGTLLDANLLQQDADAISGGAPSYSTLWNNGARVSLQENKAAWFAGIVELGAGIGRWSYTPPGGGVATSFHPAVGTLLGGPQFTSRGRRAVQPFVRIQMGGARANLRPYAATREAIYKADSAVAKPLPDAAGSLPRLIAEPSASATGAHLRTNQWSYAVSGGAGADYELTPHVALRAAVDYLQTWLFSQEQMNVQISTGFNFRFGE